MNAPNIEWASITELQHALAASEISSCEIVDALLGRIDAVDRNGPTLRSILETNPDVIDLANASDLQRSLGDSKPLQGIPILLKDNIDTADGMQTTAGSLALLHFKPARDAFVVNRLRAAGAIILGKTNMSEWANFRGKHSISGWSARGGQACNPYVLDRSPCGSSSGSGSAVAAGFAPVALGTETDGSILCPAAFNGSVGIKPTVGLTSRNGVIPISHSQDTVGPMARCVADAALVLSVIAGPDPDDPSTSAARLESFTDSLVPDGLRGARIGIPRETYFGYSPKVDAIIESAIVALREAGAEIIDPVNLNIAESKSEIDVLLYEFKAGLNTYLARRAAPGVQNLADLIAFNEAHALEELQYFGQEMLVRAESKGGLASPEYLAALAESRRLSRDEGIDKVMDENALDALAMPTAGLPFLIDPINGDSYGGGAATPAAMAGYPAITVPAGYSFGLPVGLTFMGRAFSESTLIRLAYALEQSIQVWRPPTFIPTLGDHPSP